MAEFHEYPKVIHCASGTFTVQSADEEATYRAPFTAPEPVETDDATDPTEAEPVKAPAKKKAAPKVGAKKK